MDGHLKYKGVLCSLISNWCGGKLEVGAKGTYVSLLPKKHKVGDYLLLEKNNSNPELANEFVFVLKVVRLVEDYEGGISMFYAEVEVVDMLSKYLRCHLDSSGKIYDDNGIQVDVSK